ncbi:MAG: hypothetical protein AAFY08_11915 [Planctomycetota bacterium]
MSRRLVDLYRQHAERLRWQDDEFNPSGFTHILDDSTGRGG